MFGKVCGEDRVIVRFRIRFRSEDDREILPQCYSEVWVTLMLMVRSQVQGAGLVLGTCVR